MSLNMRILCGFLGAILGLTAMGPNARSQDLSDLTLGPMMRIGAGPDDSFAFTCMVEIKRPTQAQLTVRLWSIANGQARPVTTSVFVWRGDENAGAPVQGQIVLFGQSGADVGRKGRHYLTMLVGIEGNPVQKSSTAGPLVVDNAARWWTRYGFDAPQAANNVSPRLLYVMGSGESVTASSLAELQELSKQQKQTFAALTVELGALTQGGRAASQ